MSWTLASETAQNVLRAMADLAPVGVPRSLLRTVLNLPEATGMRDPLGKAIDELCRLSLAELDSNANPIAHRLVLAFVRHRNVRDGKCKFDECHQALQSQMGRAEFIADAQTIRELELLVPHAEDLLATGRLNRCGLQSIIEPSRNAT